MNGTAKATFDYVIDDIETCTERERVHIFDEDGFAAVA